MFVVFFCQWQRAVAAHFVHSCFATKSKYGNAVNNAIACGAIYMRVSILSVSGAVSTFAEGAEATKIPYCVVRVEKANKCEECLL